MVSGFPNQVAITEPSFGSTVNVDNKKDKYVVHFYLPDRDFSNVKAVVDGNQLQLTAKNESKKETTDKTGSSAEFSADEYSQIITLPGPIQADKMKIDRKESTVTVILPKA